MEGREGGGTGEKASPPGLCPCVPAAPLSSATQQMCPYSPGVRTGRLPTSGSGTLGYEIAALGSEKEGTALGWARKAAVAVGLGVGPA